MGEVAVLKSSGLIGSDEVRILKDSLFKGFTDPEVNYCVAISNQLNLSPLLKQIHFVKRGTSVVAQVGIDGFRLTAQRAGGYAGSLDAVFEFGSDKKQPIKASVTVFKMVEGQKCEFTASARWDEYFPGEKQGTMWRKMPATMLAKCAEALALRKAFPAELSALRSDEEMQQADGPSKADRVQAAVAPKEPAIETTATQVNEDAEPPEESAPEKHSCSACGTELIKSKTKPVLYCPQWQDDSKGKHSKVYLD